MKKVNNTFKNLLGLALFVLTVMALGYAIAHSEEHSITIGVPVERAWLGCTSEIVAIHVGEIQAKEGLGKAVLYFQDNQLICGTFPPTSWFPYKVAWSHKFPTFTLKVVSMFLVGHTEVKIWVLTSVDVIGWKEP
jgi:hypothetical protein